MRDGPDTAADEEWVAPDDAVIGRGLKISLWVIVGLAAVAGAGFWWTRSNPEPDKVIEKDLTGIEDLTPDTQRAPKVVFRDVTEAAGIRFRHENGAVGGRYLPETMGAGAAFFDYDGDGDQDLLLTNGTRWPKDRGGEPARAHMALYANDGTGKFTDVTVDAGLAVPCYGMGPAVADFDGDGDVDLFVAAVGANLLFRNDGGRFVECGVAAGVAGAAEAWSSSAGFFDADNDGDLDLFVCNYVEWDPGIDDRLAFSMNGRDRAYGPPTNYRGTFSSLYRNEGGGRFVDVSAESGVQVKNRATGAPAGKALAVAFFDFDADGFVDVFVANDTVQNFLLRNRGDGTFEEIGTRAGVGFDGQGQATGAMGVDVADYRGDGSLGIAVGNFANEKTSLYVADRNPLQFSDEATVEGIGSPSRVRLTFGLFFFDYDLDGRLDFLQVNGHIEDAIHEVQPSQTHAQPAQLFWNQGPDARSCFLPIPAAAMGDLAAPIVGRSVVYADIDGDLDLDVLITEVGGAPRLLRNDQDLGHHAVRLVLRGKGMNRDAILARVSLRVAGREVRRWVAPTRTYLGQVELPITVGLGRLNTVDSVEVRWPNGRVQPVQDVRIDGVTVVEQR